MTREEAIEMLKILKEQARNSGANTFVWDINIDSFNFVIDMVIKFLEQEPKNNLTVDAVSKKAVLEIYDEWFATCNIADKKESPKAKINALPQVTSIRPKGYWIKEKSIYGWDGHSYQCSVCGRSIHLDVVVEDLADYPYCHCGAEMEEVEE